MYKKVNWLIIFLTLLNNVIQAHSMYVLCNIVVVLFNDEMDRHNVPLCPHLQHNFLLKYAQ